MDSPFDSPLTKELIKELKSFFGWRGALVNELLPKLNSHLEPGRQFLGESGTKYFYIMMRPDDRAWHPPNGEIVLAMQKVLQEVKNT